MSFLSLFSKFIFSACTTLDIHQIRERGNKNHELIMNLSFTNLLLYKSVPGVVVALAAPAEGAALTAGSTGSDRIQSQSDSTGPATRYYR